MTTTINPSDDSRNAALDAMLARANGGTIRIFSGAKPANGEAAETGELLSEVPLVTPAFAPAVAGVATLDADPDLVDTSANASGLAAWYRIVGSSAGKVFDGTCGVTGSGESLILDDLNIIEAGTVTVLSGTVAANQ